MKKPFSEQWSFWVYKNCYFYFSILVHKGYDYIPNITFAIVIFKEQL